MSELNQKVVIFAASSAVIPVINSLLAKDTLVGVVLNGRVDTDSYQLELQLQQAKIPYIRYQPGAPEQVVFQVEIWGANIGLVYTFSHRLPSIILDSFTIGTYNLHASYLPKYRGAMPLYWQIRNNETQTAISIIKVEPELDAGDMMFQESLPLHPNDTFNSLGHTIAQRSPALVTKFLKTLSAGTLEGVPQQGEISVAPIPSQQDLMVNWQTMTAADITAMARAGNPLFNGALVVWKQSYIGLLQATLVDHADYGVPFGTVLHIGEPEGLVISARGGALRFDILSVNEGVFSGGAFAERFQLTAGEQFSSP
ncbi:methionyl-tRNA formyltransferase [Photobacterium minamisatsumaniensis]|uniref:methionyl-tRNA formyltransferase n=1 Tax=Photobacterium minamisatsumaniensis TaxID=2910233 RepID=UPI003D129C9E